MGKKKGGCGGEKYLAAEEAEVPAAREFALKVAMHCRCHGCTDKLRAAVRDLTQAPGVEAADSSAAESTGEVRLLATADPEKLRRRLRRATGKRVDLLLPKERAAAAKKQQEDVHADAAALQVLLAELQLQAPAPVARQGYGGQMSAAPWANQQQQQQQMQMLGAGCYGTSNTGGYGTAYPWPSSSSSSYYHPAPPASVWGGAYGYAPQAPAPAHGGYYGAPAWLGHGY